MSWRNKTTPPSSFVCLLENSPPSRPLRLPARLPLALRRIKIRRNFLLSKRLFLRRSIPGFLSRAIPLVSSDALRKIRNVSDFRIAELRRAAKSKILEFPKIFIKGRAIPDFSRTEIFNSLAPSITWTNSLLRFNFLFSFCYCTRHVEIYATAKQRPLPFSHLQNYPRESRVLSR